MSGRTAAVDAVIADPDIIYIGAATGGVWKSVNGGLTWKHPGLEDPERIHRILLHPAAVRHAL